MTRRHKKEFYRKDPHAYAATGFRPMTPQARRAPALPVVLDVLPCSGAAPCPLSIPPRAAPAHHAAAAGASLPLPSLRQRAQGGAAPRLGARLRVVALAQIVRQLVDDDGAADDGVGASQRDLRSQRGETVFPASPRGPGARAQGSSACESVMVNSQPSAEAVTLPRSPAWRTASVGAPWVLPAGLKCGPAPQGVEPIFYACQSSLALACVGSAGKRAPVDMHPLVVSPNSWMWKPCCAAAKKLFKSGISCPA